jgi:hypothetical protein
MRHPQIQERKLDIVLIGNFNPHIFQPEWFVLQKLLGEKEGASAQVEIIHSDITVFNLEWLRFEVTRNRLVATTKDERYYEVLRDLIVGTFIVLSHTPLKMMGVNTTFDYLLTEESTWHQIGHTLAPKDIWYKVMDSPGLRTLTIESGVNLKDNYKNIVKVSVSPTDREYGLRIHINDHFELRDLKRELLGSSDIINIFKTEWDKSQEKAVTIDKKLFEELPSE